MPFYLLAVFFVGMSFVLFWIGITYNAVTSLAAFQKQNTNPILSRRLRVIFLIMGERWGTLWIRTMGKLLILAAAAAIAAAFYVAIFKPERIFAS